MQEIWVAEYKVPCLTPSQIEAELVNILNDVSFYWNGTQAGGGEQDSKGFHSTRSIASITGRQHSTVLSSWIKDNIQWSADAMMVLRQGPKTAKTLGR